MMIMVMMTMLIHTLIPTYMMMMMMVMKTTLIHMLIHKYDDGGDNNTHSQVHDGDNAHTYIHDDEGDANGNNE
jgi:hypothetical protein